MALSKGADWPSSSSRVHQLGRSGNKTPALLIPIRPKRTQPSRRQVFLLLLLPHHTLQLHINITCSTLVLIINHHLQSTIRSVVDGFLLGFALELFVLLLLPLLLLGVVVAELAVDVGVPPPAPAAPAAATMAAAVADAFVLLLVEDMLVLLFLRLSTTGLLWWRSSSWVPQLFNGCNLTNRN